MKIQMASAICGVVLVVATAAFAQNITGVVSHIDASTRTVYFTDGRIMHLEPDATLMVDGRAVSLDQLARGNSVSVTTSAAGAQPAQAPHRDVLTAHPPVDATGTVARVDPQAGIVTLEDGRMLKATGQTRVWQAAEVSTLKKGDTVFIRDGRPVIAQQPGAAAGSRMGTVMQVDPANAVVLLSDGTVIRISPATNMRMGSQRLALSDLQRGDEVLIRLKQPSAASTGASASRAARADAADGPSALPRQGFFRGTVDAEDVQVLFRHQAGGG